MAHCSMKQGGWVGTDYFFFVLLRLADPALGLATGFESLIIVFSPFISRDAIRDALLRCM